MSGSTLPEAFRLVRQSLSARPRVFHDLLRDGIASFSGATSSNTSTGTGTVKGKGKLGAGETIVPEGHPFISANYLKTRVLPILSSQGLISKSTKTGYALAPPESTPVTNHWDRLLSGESPSSLGYEHSTVRSELRQARKELRAEANGDVERLMWYRSGRAMGRLASPLDCGFLNRRNAKKRVGKDLQRLEKEERLHEAIQPWSSEGGQVRT